MKTIILLFSGVLFCSGVFSQAINFEQGTFEEILEKAKKENKLVFMDCYTTWCGPCKQLAKDVFPQKEVGAFFNQNYVSLTMDMEKGEGIELADYFDIKAYPTLLFLDANGDVLHRSQGLVTADKLIEKGSEALKLKK